LAPNAGKRGDVELEVTRRNGDTFEGIYSTEARAYRWEVQGTLHGDTIRWELTKALSGPGAEGAVGQAHVEGRLADDRIEALYCDADSTANLHLAAKREPNGKTGR
jgi:hypothetical protein